MFRFLVNKISFSILVIFGVITLVFALFFAVPGDGMEMALGQNTDVKTREMFKKELGLDKTPIQQYFSFLGNISPIGFSKNNIEKDIIVTFGAICIKTPNLGLSFQSRKDVSSIIGSALPGTFVLAFLSIVIAAIIGIIFGIIAALNQNTFLDRFLVFISTIGISIPSYFAAVIFVFVFAYLFGSFTGLPVSGSMYEYDAFNGKVLTPINFVLPVFTLAIRPLAVIVQLMRTTLIDVMQMEYIRTAYAKRLSKWRIIIVHALKNSLAPVITALSGWFASLLAGSVFVEYIFGWKGLGKVIVDALMFLDLPVIIGSVITISICFVIINILVDLSYKWLDPRVKLND